jgi:hypothetical protein
MPRKWIWTFSCAWQEAIKVFTGSVNKFCVKKIIIWDLRWYVEILTKGHLGEFLKSNHHEATLNSFPIFSYDTLCRWSPTPKKFLLHQMPSFCLISIFISCSSFLWVLHTSSECLVCYSSSQGCLQTSRLECHLGTWKYVITLVYFLRNKKVVLCMKLTFIQMWNFSSLVYPIWIVPDGDSDVPRITWRTTDIIIHLSSWFLKVASCYVCSMMENITEKNS